MTFCCNKKKIVKLFPLFYIYSICILKLHTNERITDSFILITIWTFEHKSQFISSEPLLVTMVYYLFKYNNIIWLINLNAACKVAIIIFFLWAQLFKSKKISSGSVFSDNECSTNYIFGKLKMLFSPWLLLVEVKTRRIQYFCLLNWLLTDGTCQWTFS